MKPLEIRFLAAAFAWLGCLSGVCVAGVVLPSAVRTPEIEAGMRQKAAVSDLKADLVYKKVGDTDFTLDLMLPRVKTGADGKALFPKGTPIVLFLHGGGWRVGNRYGFPEDAKFFSENGMALACVSYRFIGNGNTVATCVTDCFDAARFLSKHASEYGLDPSTMLAYGHSAGGHLTLMMVLADPAAFLGDPALAKERFRFVGGVDTSGHATFTDPEVWRTNRWLASPAKCVDAFGGTWAQTQALREKTSPITWLKKDSPPLLIIHAQDDLIVGIGGSDLFVKKAQALGADVQYVRASSGGHRLADVEGAPGVPHRVFTLETLKRMAHRAQSPSE